MADEKDKAAPSSAGKRKRVDKKDGLPVMMKPSQLANGALMWFADCRDDFAVPPTHLVTCRDMFLRPWRLLVTREQDGDNMNDAIIGTIYADVPIWRMKKVRKSKLELVSNLQTFPAPTKVVNEPTSADFVMVPGESITTSGELRTMGRSKLLVEEDSAYFLDDRKLTVEQINEFIETSKNGLDESGSWADCFQEQLRQWFQVDDGISLAHGAAVPNVMARIHYV